MHALLAKHYARQDWTEALKEMRAEALDAALFEEEREAVEKDYDTYGRIMERYVAHYPDSDWKVLAVEQEFVVSLPEPVKIQVDLLVEASDGVWVVDHKTMRDFDKDLESRLDFDPQISVYVMGLRALGFPVVGGIHNLIRMRLPAEPAVNKDGTLSRAPILTDEATVRETIARTGARISEEDLEAYLAKLPKDAFFRRYSTIRDHDEIAATVAEVRAKIAEREWSRTSGIVSRTMIRDCVYCAFYRPCLAALKGGDEEAILQEGFVKDRRRNVGGGDWQ